MTARSGHTLPVFAVAAAMAALKCLTGSSGEPVRLDLLTDGVTEIPVGQCARLDADSALAVTTSDPGDNLDLTDGTPVWAWVRLVPRQDQAIVIEAGEGVGKTASGAGAVYRFARQLFEVNLIPLVPEDRTALVRVILPEGRVLARRTSNAAFGILEGLALLGTSGISHPLSAPEKLESLRADLQSKAAHSARLVFCIGASGLQVADRLGLPPEHTVRTANWIGPLLVEAGLLGVRELLLIGYHGKLIKLAGGIFHTHSAIADGKREILVALGLRAGVPAHLLVELLDLPTADDAHRLLREHGWELPVFERACRRIDEQSAAYIQRHADRSVTVHTFLTDRLGQVIARSRAE